MEKDKDKDCDCDDACCGEKWDKAKWHKYHHGGSRGGACGGFYFLVLIGAMVYYMQHDTGFWMALVKSIVWPAMLIYKVYVLLKM